MHVVNRIRKFLGCECGAITADWFALTLGAAGIAFTAASLLADGQLQVAGWIDAQLVDVRSSQ